MNSASVKKSRRLKRVLAVLRRGGSYTTRDIIRKAKVCAVNSIVAELRDNGYNVLCKRKGMRWHYMLSRA